MAPKVHGGDSSNARRTETRHDSRFWLRTDLLISVLANVLELIEKWHI
jgi:hypothetical protein